MDSNKDVLVYNCCSNGTKVLCNKCQKRQANLLCCEWLVFTVVHQNNVKAIAPTDLVNAAKADVRQNVLVHQLASELLISRRSKSK
jgi:hypothetical protein